jgi:hypothetical protein
LNVEGAPLGRDGAGTVAGADGPGPGSAIVEGAGTPETVETAEGQAQLLQWHGEAHGEQQVVGRYVTIGEYCTCCTYRVTCRMTVTGQPVQGSLATSA